MDSFIKLLEGEKVLLEIEYHSCLFIEKAFLTNKRIIEHEKKAFCGKDEEVYCTYLKDILEFNYSSNPFCFCCSCWKDKNIVFKTSLSKRIINIGEADNLSQIAAIFTQAIENAHNEE